MWSPSICLHRKCFLLCYMLLLHSSSWSLYLHSGLIMLAMHAFCHLLCHMVECSSYQVLWL
jgi:hypothetical protein